MFSKAQYYLGMIGCEDDKLELYFDKLQDIETVNDNLLERGLKPLYKE